MTSDVCIDFVGVVKRYGQFVLNVPRLEVRAGEVLCLVGPTGAGKSTLLRLLAGLEAPCQGRVRFGQHVLGCSDVPLSVLRSITMVHQRPLLLSGTVRSNVAYGVRLRGRARQDSPVQRVLERVGLGALADRPARSLSGGQTQLVALARALVLETDVLLLDEPTANLDPAHVSLVEQAIASTHAEHRTCIVWATHNLFQSRRVSDRVGLLLNGQVVEVCKTDKFFEDPSDERTASFVDGKMVY